MYISGQVIKNRLKISDFKNFSLEDDKIIQPYIEESGTLSCEYSFANLFVWQDSYKMSWTIYQDRLLICDKTSKDSLMPLGEDLFPEDLAFLSLNLKNHGLSPDFNLATHNYIEKYPEIKNYYTLKEERDYSEYIYDVERLALLSGQKLHKKRNLISQFKRLYPDFQIHPLKGDLIDQVKAFARHLFEMRGATPSKTLQNEMKAMELSFKHFEPLGLEGLVVKVGEQIIAFSLFSRLSESCYDIHFEKTDINFKGAAQVINQETAKYLTGRCRYLNREQDLGIKGLRQAKISYDPVKLLTPVKLIFNP